MSKPKVLVTRRWPQEVEDRIAAHYDATFNSDDIPMTSAEIGAVMGEYDAILPTVTDKIDACVFESENIRVKILGNYGVGYSHIDEASASAKGIVVTNTPEVLSECTADIAMTLLLMAARRAGEGEREVRANGWTGWRPTHMIGSKVSGKSLGIIGFGRIGQEMAQRAHFGFGMNIIVQNRSKVAAEILDQYNATQVDNVEALLPQCDFVSLHCPGGDANRHLINAERLALMKAGSYLINTARGEVVDEDALVAALNDGPMAGAGLDVFDGEPKINKKLFAFENLVMLPHLGSATMETRAGMGHRVVDNLDAFFAGKAPADRVI